MKTRVLGAACLASLIALGPAIGRAATDEPTYALSWSRSDGARECITAGALAKAVEARLGRSVFVSPAAAEFTLEARIEGAPWKWSASITVQDREGHRIGQRELTSAERDCRALDPSLSLMLALAIDPNATLVTGAPLEPLPPAPTLETVERRPPVVAPRPVAPEVGSPPSTPGAASGIAGAYAEASLRVSFGLLPGPVVPGLEVATMAPLQESWLIRVGASAWLPAQAEGPDGGVFLSQFAAAVGLCGRWRSREAFLLACAGAEPGVLAAAGYGFNQSIEADYRFTLTIGPSAKVAAHLGGRFWAQLGGDLLVPIIRHQFYYLNADRSEVEVFRQPPVAGAASLAILLAFP
jgi:hypothetical protein